MKMGRRFWQASNDGNWKVLSRDVVRVSSFTLSSFFSQLDEPGTTFFSVGRAGQLWTVLEH